MPMMTLHRRYRLATIKGHAVQFEPDTPVYVPPAIVPEAVAVGARMVEGQADVVPQDPPKRNSGPEDAVAREKVIIDAFTMIVAANDRKAFTAGGVPTVAAVEDLVGFDVDRREVNAAWAQRAEYLASGQLDADGKWND